MSRRIILIIGTLALVACATDSTYQKKTAEFIKCSPDDIQISDVNESGANSWKAICKQNAQIYRCNKDGCTESK